MRCFSRLAVILVTLSLLGGCAGPQGDRPPPLSFAPISEGGPEFGTDIMSFPGPRRGLPGRIIRTGSVSDIVLMKKEIVLTFDDGPVPGKTKRILDALDRHDVKATFLMVGQMASSYPDLVREVADRGHTVGTHTQGHPNLASMSFEAAMAQVAHGERSVSAAMVPSRHRAAPFFRFPYLASTPALRSHMAARGTVVIDVDIDSKDYFVSSPSQLRSRALAKIEAKGSGIVLFHDLHQRTAAILPDLLDDLHARGFKVVHLVPEDAPMLLN